MRNAVTLLSIILPLIGAAPAGAATPTYRFRKIVDSTTIPPGAVEPLAAIEELAFDGQVVAFRAHTAGGLQGIYLWDGATLTTVADTQSSVPNGGGMFDEFHGLALDAGRVAFAADGTLKDGVYTNLGGALRSVADSSTAMPGVGGAAFVSFSESHGVAIDGQTIAFSGLGSSGAGAQEGVYVETAGSLARVADRSTPIPGAGQSFLFFNEVDVSGGAVTFMGGRGTGGFNGNYTTGGAAPGGVRVVANANTAIGGLVNPLSFFTPSSVRIEGSELLFAVRDAGQNRGIYRESAGVVTTVADKLTLDPVTGATFTAVGNAYSLSDGAAAFYGASTGPGGIYVQQDGPVSNVIKTGDALQGKVVSGMSLYANSLANGRIAFAATFNDGTSAAYLAEPWNFPAGPNGRTFAPLFDAEASAGAVHGAGSQIDVLRSDDPPGAVDQRAVFEFDLSDLPAGAQIQSARLELDLSLLESTPTEGPTLTAYGYTGNGALEAADAEHTSLVLGQSPMAVELGAFEFSLDAAAVEQLLEAGSVLGVVLQGDPSSRQLGLRTLETWTGNPALLSLTYAAPPSADFDGSGAVDSGDLETWTVNFGDTDAERMEGDADGDHDVDGADLLLWQRTLGTPPPANAASAPEPNSAALVTSAAALTIARGRRRRHVG